jgi:hypothetical protein
MSSDLPVTTSETELEEAGAIVAHYLDRQYGAVPLGKLKGALSEILRVYRTGVRHPVLLANKAIELVERADDHSKAA